MEIKGSIFYDKQSFFEQYMARRHRSESPNEAIEGPIIKQLIGDVNGKRIADLGCGDALFGKWLLEEGAYFYCGVEGSALMVEKAKETLFSLHAEIFHETMESCVLDDLSYDIITSRMAIHYVEEIQSLFLKVYKSLKSDGQFIFSVQHPLTTSSFLSKQKGERKNNWIVDDYFIEGKRSEPWMNEIVVKYHRTIEHYFTALIKAGFTITALKEGHPIRENFSSDEEYERRMRIPVILVFSCKK